MDSPQVHAPFPLEFFGAAYKRRAFFLLIFQHSNAKKIKEEGEGNFSGNCCISLYILKVTNFFPYYYTHTHQKTRMDYFTTLHSAFFQYEAIQFLFGSMFEIKTVKCKDMLFTNFHVTLSQMSHILDFSI